eukprot:149893-Prorocentrum_minimum.AAC.1
MQSAQGSTQSTGKQPSFTWRRGLKKRAEPSFTWRRGWMQSAQGLTQSARNPLLPGAGRRAQLERCLLYTSDAADDTPC